MEKLQSTDRNFWMKRAEEVARNSGCVRTDCRWGAIAVRDGKIIESGYNDVVGKIRPCAERGFCVRQQRGIPSGTQREISYCICAEQRMICNAARDGVDLKGAEVYVTGISCTFCVRLMIECGIVRVIQKDAGHNYKNAFSEEIAREGGMELVILNENAR